MSDRTRRRCWRPVGPFGLFQTGPHRSVREVLRDYGADRLTRLLTTHRKDPQ